MQGPGGGAAGGGAVVMQGNGAVFRSYGRDYECGFSAIQSGPAAGHRYCFGGRWLAAALLAVQGSH